MNDCEQRAQEMEQQLGRAGIYFRFSVEQGMQTEYPGQAADPSWVLAQTESYLADHETGENIGAFVQNINSSGILATLDQLSKSFSPLSNLRTYNTALQNTLAAQGYLCSQMRL
jgi:hypothetical protein